MKSLAETLNEIVANVVQVDVERKLAEYYAERGISCQRCDDYGTIGIRTGPGLAPTNVPCPECGGRKGSPEEVAYRRIARAGLPFNHGTFENWDFASNPSMNHVYEQVKAWADNPDGGLIVIGDPGRGKTHLLQAAAASLAISGVGALYKEGPALMDWLRAGINAQEGDLTYQERLNVVQESTVFILDDYGQGSTTAWSDGIAEQIIAFRYGWDKPWLLATNTGPDQWGERLCSRFSDRSRVTMLACEGIDYRTLKGAR